MVQQRGPAAVLARWQGTERGRTVAVAAASHRIKGRLPQPIRRAYRRCMTVLVRLLQFLLAVFALLTAAQFVMLLGSDVVGPVEKVALLAVAAACLWACLALPRLAARRRPRRLP